jgi:hypothetical protein
MTALNSHAQLPVSTAVRPGTAVLDILAGLHQGVTLGLDRDLYTVGRTSSADVVLHDDAIADLHVRLRLYPHAVAIEALGGDVTVIDVQQRTFIVRRGHGHRAALPVQLQIGGARLALRATVPRRTARTWGAPQHALGAALLLAGGAVFAFHQEAIPDFSTNLPPTAAAAKVMPTVKQARGWLDQQLAQAGLGGITTTGGDHQIRVAGTYPAEHKAQWAAVQQGFDSRYGEYLVLHGTVAPASVPQPPRVRFQAVWFGNAPYVIDGSGRRLFPGAAVEDRWVINAIENGQVILARGDERFTFTL